MIRNQYYIVLDSTQVQDRPIGVTRLGERLVFWRDPSGHVCCATDRCVHRGAALSKGQIIHDHLQCPFHGLEYDPSGQVVLIPANGRNTPVPAQFRVQTYPTYEAHGFIWTWWGEDPPANLAPPRFFDDIGDDFSYGQVRDPWDAHYSRAIENQLDVVHLPFVHHNTIGAGGQTLVDGPVVQWLDNDRFRLYPYNRIDDGAPPRKAEEITVAEDRFHLEFIFPNLWQNHLSDSARIVVAFVPVDQEHTILYLRFYQNSVRIPVLRDVFNVMAMPFNVLIAHQDRRVVQTQVPKTSGLNIGEKLLQGDRPIVEYRRRRQELMASPPSATREV